MEIEFQFLLRKKNKQDFMHRRASLHPERLLFPVLYEKLRETRWIIVQDSS